mgnify:CR=1 FL=1
MGFTTGLQPVLGEGCSCSATMRALSVTFTGSAGAAVRWTRARPLRASRHRDARASHIVCSDSPTRRLLSHAEGKRSVACSASGWRPPWLAADKERADSPTATVPSTTSEPSSPEQVEELELTISVRRSVSDIDEEAWNACSGSTNPFVTHAFLDILEQSGSVSKVCALKLLATWRVSFLMAP